MEQERIEEIEKMDTERLRTELKEVGEMMHMEKIWMYGSKGGSESEQQHLLNNERLRKEYRFIDDLLKSRMA
jgi:hypothetical protein